MMSTNELYDAERAAMKLAEKDEEALFRELGKRIEDVNQPGGAERQLQFEAAFVDSSTTMGDSYLEDIGRRWFRKAEADLMKFVCGRDDADRNKLTGGKSIPQVAGALVTAGLLAAIAAPPAWVIVAATIAAQRITATGIDAWCEVYYEREAKKASAQ